MGDTEITRSIIDSNHTIDWKKSIIFSFNHQLMIEYENIFISKDPSTSVIICSTEKDLATYQSLVRLEIIDMYQSIKISTKSIKNKSKRLNLINSTFSFTIQTKNGNITFVHLPDVKIFDNRYFALSGTSEIFLYDHNDDWGNWGSENYQVFDVIRNDPPFYPISKGLKKLMIFIFHIGMKPLIYTK